LSGNMKKIILPLLSSLFVFSLSALADDKEFMCDYINGTSADYVREYLMRTCDLTKPFSASVVEGSASYAQQALICCTKK
jgi:hypothetical protein